MRSSDRRFTICSRVSGFKCKVCTMAEYNTKAVSAIACFGCLYAIISKACMACVYQCNGKWPNSEGLKGEGGKGIIKEPSSLPTSLSSAGTIKQYLIKPVKRLPGLYATPTPVHSFGSKSQPRVQVIRVPCSRNGRSITQGCKTDFMIKDWICLVVSACRPPLALLARPIGPRQ